MLRSFQGSQFWLTQADLPQRFRVAALATAVEGVGCWKSLNSSLRKFVDINGGIFRPWS